jgi:DNA-directed RNA polymerase specialized sigma24 family protein
MMVQARRGYLQVIGGPAHHYLMEVSLAALRASAERIAQLLDELSDERERRDEMVVVLVDQGGYSRREIAAAARISPKSVCAALSAYG